MNAKAIRRTLQKSLDVRMTFVYFRKHRTTFASFFEAKIGKMLRKPARQTFSDLFFSKSNLLIILIIEKIFAGLIKSRFNSLALCILCKLHLQRYRQNFIILRQQGHV